MKQVFLSLIIILLFKDSFGQAPQVSSGSIRHFENFPSVFVKARNVDVWLPSDYHPKHKYPVLYMNDGRDMFDSLLTDDHREWTIDEKLSRLKAEGKINSCIVVAVSNNQELRHPEYFPLKPFQLLTEKQQDSLYHLTPAFSKSVFLTAKIISGDYLKFLVKELKPFIDRKFSTKKNSASTFIGGSSMGGLISMYAVCEYPKIFGGAICLSTHWSGFNPGKNSLIPDAFVKYLDAHAPDAETHKFYFDYGSINLDYYYKPFQTKVDSLFRAKGYSEKNYMSKEYKGADHSVKTWSDRIDVPLYFLFKKDDD